MTQALTQARSERSGKFVAGHGARISGSCLGLAANVLRKARQRQPWRWRRSQRALRYARDALGLADALARLTNRDAH